MSKGDHQVIKSENPREFFIQIPSFLDYLPELDPFAWRLYSHYLRVCGQDGHCYEFTSTTAKLCNVSARTVRYKRQILVDLNLIAVWYEGDSGRERVYILIRDLWEINARFLGILRTTKDTSWVADWIHEQLASIEQIDANPLTRCKHPHAYNAPPHAYNAPPHARDADPAARDADPAARDADPAARDADRERSNNKIPYTENRKGEGNVDPLTPPPSSVAVDIIRLAEEAASAESFDGPVNKTPKVTINRKLNRRKTAPPIPSSPCYDGTKFVRGRIPAGIGATPVEVYYESFSINNDDERLEELDEDDLTRVCPDLEILRSVCVAYRRSAYRKGDIQLIIDWYRDPARLPSNRFANPPSANGHSNGYGGNSVAAYAEKERQRYEEDFGRDTPLTPEQEQWFWEQKRRLEQSNRGV